MSEIHRCTHITEDTPANGRPYVTGKPTLDRVEMDGRSKDDMALRTHAWGRDLGTSPACQHQPRRHETMPTIGATKGSALGVPSGRGFLVRVPSNVRQRTARESGRWAMSRSRPAWRRRVKLHYFNLRCRRAALCHALFRAEL